jgi:type IV secretory pathway protease TraF
MMAIVLLRAMTLAHAAKRYGQVVHEVVKTCGPGTGGSQISMHNPTTNRNAGACFVQGQWWIVIDGEPIEDDNIVSVFPRKTAQSLDDVIAYLKAAGYQ